MGESGPIRVFARNGKWLVDYGSYAHGYHDTRSEAIETAMRDAKKEQRDLVIEGEPGGAPESDLPSRLPHGRA